MANKAELVSEVASKTKLTKKDAATAVDAIFSSIQEDLSKGKKVQLIGFEIKIPASVVPAFRPGKALKEAVK